LESAVEPPTAMASTSSARSKISNIVRHINECVSLHVTLGLLLTGSIGCFTSTDSVKIYVGPKRKLWVLPEGFLWEKVEYFRVAFKSGFKEGLKKELYLKDDDPATFAVLVD